MEPLDQQWPANRRFKQFSLRAAQLSLLPAAHGLVVDKLTGTITLVNWQETQFLEVIDSFDDEQFTLTLTLLERWPSYVPYEMLLHQLGIQLTDQDIEDLERVRTAGRAGESEEEQAQGRLARERIQPLLQTLRDLLRDCRCSLQSIGIDIAAVMDYGLRLVQYKEIGVSPVEKSV